MQFGLDLLSLDRSYHFFYGHSIIYLVLAAFFVISRIKYNERSNRTSNTYVITRISNLLLVQCLALGLYSVINVLIYDFGFQAYGILDGLYLILTFCILFINSICPYYLFIVIRKQIRSIGTFQGGLNRAAFILVSLFCTAYLVFIIKLCFNSEEMMTTSTGSGLFKIVISLALAQFLCFLLTLKDVHRFVAELLHGAFLSKRTALFGLVLFVYGPMLVWPLSIIYLLPIFFIAVVSFIFVVHMVSQSRAVSRDFLTGMNNRNELYRYLSRLFEKDDDLTPALNIIFIDINKFKSINDTFGHSQGDKALICMANCLRQSAFSKDCFLSRYAGDEFIIVLRESGENTVQKFIDTLNQKIKHANDTNTDPYRLSVAIGSVSYSEEYYSVEKFIEAADRKMYDRKADASKAAPSIM